MFNMNSGYNGYSMSVRACEAYEMGERPLSKWTKGDIVDYYKDSKEILIQTFGLSKALQFLIKLEKVDAKSLKDLCLHESSWHHTSKCCNKTSFYSISEVDDYIFNKIMNFEKAKKEEEKIEKIEVTYPVWCGTRNHPYIAFYETKIAIKKGDWAILEDGSRKKLSANAVTYSHL